ncbi:14 kDa proline-rich protein DC2.15 [Linum grandiflorum]
METKNQLTALLLIANLLLFTTFSAACVPCTKPKPPPAAAPPAKCPKDYLKLAACVDLLGGLAHVVVGTPPSSPCCSVLKGLADVEAALCLCTVVKVNVLNIKLTVPVAVGLLLSACSLTPPPGFKC